MFDLSFREVINVVIGGLMLACLLYNIRVSSKSEKVLQPVVLFPTIPEGVNIHRWRMSFAFLAGVPSKDPRTKVGACLALSDGSIFIGYNGCPCGFNDDMLKGPNKYDVVIHAEANCLAQVDKAKIVSDGDATMYVPFKPCPRCAILMMQYGIKRVIYYMDYQSGTNNDKLLDLICYGGNEGRNSDDIRMRILPYAAFCGEPPFFVHQHFGVDKK